MAFFGAWGHENLHLCTHATENRIRIVFYKPSVHESAYSCTDGQSMVRHYERDDAMGYQAAKQV